MPIVALLHQNKLESFKSWLDHIGHEHRPTTAAYQVLQVKWGSSWQPIYKRENAVEHLSVPVPLYPLVRRFIRESRAMAIGGTADALARLQGAAEPTPPAGYTAEELERDNPFNAWMRDVEV